MAKTITKKETMTNEEVELEIQRLLQSDKVRLAKKERQIKDRRRQYMYSLRCMEKRGRQLEYEGYTLENIADRLLSDIDPEIEGY